MRGSSSVRLAVLSAVAVLIAGCTSLSSDDPSAGMTQAEDHRQVSFRDVAQEVGLHFQQGAFRWGVSPDPEAMLGGGVCWLDFDEDGWMDLFVVNSYSRREADRWLDEGGLPRSALFRNIEGHFVDESRGSGADLTVRGNGCVAADLDLDGRTDLFVTTTSGGVLLWNAGDGRFREGTREAGVDAFGWLSGASVGDVNGDGWPDLFVAGYADLNNPRPKATQGFPQTYLGVRDRLYLSEGRGAERRVTFQEVGMEAGLEVVDFEPGLGALFFDFDRDGDLDLYLANDGTSNRLYRNVAWPGGAKADPEGLGFRFEELAGGAGVADPNAGMGVAVADYDADTVFDIFVTNARGQGHGLFRGEDSENRKISYVDIRTEVGVDLAVSTGWGASWIDVDHDSDLDLVVVNGEIPVTDLQADRDHILLLENQMAQGEPALFRDVSEEAGLRAVGGLLARGSAAADYDNDGDLDVAINTIGGRLTLLENTGAGGNWLMVGLEGSPPGALVTAVLPDGRELIRELRAGSSYLSSEDPRIHFGLGPVTSVEQLTVRWPGGEITEVDDPLPNRLIQVEAPR